MGIRAERRAKWAETSAREQAERDARKIVDKLENNPRIKQLAFELRALDYIKEFEKKNGRKPTESEMMKWVFNQRD